MKRLVVLIALFCAVTTTQAALRSTTKTYIYSWLNGLYNTPTSWVNTTDPCTWLGFTCTSGSPQDLEFITLDTSNRVYNMTGDFPPLKTWQQSGAFPSFVAMMIRGARFGPYVPSWIMDYWFVGWNLTDTTSATFMNYMTSNSLTWKLWLPYFIRSTDSYNNYIYFCDGSIDSLTTGLGAAPDPGCVAGFICPLPLNQTVKESTDNGLFCTILTLVSRHPTHGPITGGTQVSVVMNVPAHYSNMQCTFDGIPVNPTNFQYLQYFPNQNMLIQFDCVSPAHASGTVDIQIAWNGSQITTDGVPFDYECPPGTQEPTNATDDCVKCQPGYYSANRGDVCTPCDVGTYNDQVAATNCTPCPDGTVSNVPAATTVAVCTPCGKGYYWSAGQCLPCPVGTFTDKTGLTSCSVCPIGQFSIPNPGVRCALCPAGQYGTADPITGLPTCVDCPSGSFTPTSGMTQCIECTAGRYQPLAGQTSCDNVCPAGTYSASSNSTQPWDSGDSSLTPLAPANLPDTNNTASCIPCPPGYYSDTNASIVCKPCPLGYYTTLARSTSCIKCDTGQTTSAKASTECIDIPRVQTPGETTGISLAIILAVVAALLVVGTLSYVIYKRKQQAKLRKQIEEMQESAALQ